MDKSRLLFLSERACRVRRDILTAVYFAKSGHIGGSMSIADLLTYLYYEKLNADASDPTSPERDRLVLSKGHSCPALYSVLALKGYFAEDELKNLRHLGSMLQGHPDMHLTPGIDMSTGSLGQGFSVACGMALKAKRCGESYKVYTIIGDGESQEGMIWEAAMFASHYRLSNLIGFLDFNHLQIDGDVRDVMDPTPLDKKFEAFGWYVQTIDGHDFTQIETAICNAERSDKPSMIIMNTVKGKGVSFMENNYSWHGKAPKDDEYLVAAAELDKALEEAEEALKNG